MTASGSATCKEGSTKPGRSPQVLQTTYSRPWKTFTARIREKLPALNGTWSRHGLHSRSGVWCKRPRDLMKAVALGVQAFPAHFLEVHITPLRFYERPPLVPVFTKLKNPKRMSAITKKGGNWNNISGLFGHKPSQRQGATKLLPGELHSASQIQATIDLNWGSICALSQFTACIC